MSKLIIIDGKHYRIRRGKLVLIPEDWIGNITTKKTIRQRKSKLPSKKLKRTCLFISSKSSKQIKRGIKWVDRKDPVAQNARGEYPVGVSFYKQTGKFKASCAVNGKRQHLGYFNTPQEAFAVYKTFKENLCKQLALKWQSEIDERLFNTMMNWQIHQT